MMAGTLDTRVVQLVALLGSNHDGERLASLKALDRVLSKSGTGWSDLAARLDGEAGPSQSALDAAYSRGFADAQRRTVRKPQTAAEVAEWLAVRLNRLTDKETGFVLDMASRAWRGGDMGLTAKQLNWLASIFGRVSAQEARASA